MIVGGIGGFIVQLDSLINSVVPFLVGVAVLVIIYGLVGYVANAENEEKRREGRQFVLWGVLGVAVMLSVWGLVNIVVNTFNLNLKPAANPYAYTLQNASNAGGAPTDVPSLIDKMNYLGGNFIVPFLISVAVFIVILGVVGYVRNGANEEKRREGRSFIIWGVASIFLMLSIWGLVNILVDTFQLNVGLASSSIPQLPAFQPPAKPK